MRTGLLHNIRAIAIKTRVKQLQSFIINVIFPLQQFSVDLLPQVCREVKSLFLVVRPGTAVKRGMTCWALRSSHVTPMSSGRQFLVVVISVYEWSDIRMT